MLDAFLQSHKAKKVFATCELNIKQSSLAI
jgi:hypothetical protein